ncbi:MAG: type II toxin-antitoxin system VapC family toxin [Actinomycetota bacterium]
MSVYVDSSALLKIYFREADFTACLKLLKKDTDWISGRHTEVEVRRNLALGLKGKDYAKARDQFSRDWAAVKKVTLTKAVCESAAEIAERTGVRTLDALHLGAADQAGGGLLPFITYDVRQSKAANFLGWTVWGTKA